MQRVSDNYRKLRNTLRFLLSNLYDFMPAEHEVKFEAMQPLDQYILARLAEVDKKIRAAYDSFEFHRAYHALNEFTNTDLSALYLDVLKDRLYTFAPNHPARRSAQTALWHIAEALTRLIAPILSFTADEVWGLLPKVEGREASVHLAHFIKPKDFSSNEDVIISDWQRLLVLRTAVLKHLEQARADGYIGKGTEAMVNLAVKGPWKDVVFKVQPSSLEEFFGVSELVMQDFDEALEVEVFGSSDIHFDTAQISTQSAAGDKCERCWRYTEDRGQEKIYPTVCLRCAEALDALNFPAYEAEGVA